MAFVKPTHFGEVEYQFVNADTDAEIAVVKGQEGVLTHSFSQDYTHKLKVRVRVNKENGQIGNYSNYSNQVWIDQTFPLITSCVLSGINENGYVKNASETLTFTVSDSESGVATTEYRINSGAWASATSGSPIALGTDGDKLLIFRVTDNAGNEATTEISFKKDTVAPGNASAGTATIGRMGIYNWSNPLDSDFAGVLVTVPATGTVLARGVLDSYTLDPKDYGMTGAGSITLNIKPYDFAGNYHATGLDIVGTNAAPANVSGLVAGDGDISGVTFTWSRNTADDDFSHYTVGYKINGGTEQYYDVGNNPSYRVPMTGTDMSDSNPRVELRVICKDIWGLSSVAWTSYVTGYPRTIEYTDMGNNPMQFTIKKLEETVIKNEGDPGTNLTALINGDFDQADYDTLVGPNTSWNYYQISFVKEEWLSKILLKLKDTQTAGSQVAITFAYSNDNFASDAHYMAATSITGTEDEYGDVGFTLSEFGTEALARTNAIKINSADYPNVLAFRADMQSGGTAYWRANAIRVYSAVSLQQLEVAEIKPSVVALANQFIGETLNLSDSVTIASSDDPDNALLIDKDGIQIKTDESSYPIIIGDLGAGTFGAWFPKIYIGGDSPATAPFYVDAGGQVIIQASSGDFDAITLYDADASHQVSLGCVEDNNYMKLSGNASNYQVGISFIANSTTTTFLGSMNTGDTATHFMAYGNPLYFGVGGTWSYVMSSTTNSFYPYTDASRSLGLSSNRWKDLFLYNTTGPQISIDSSAAAWAYIRFQTAAANKWDIGRESTTFLPDYFYIFSHAVNQRVLTINTSGNFNFGYNTTDAAGITYRLAVSGKSLFDMGTFTGNTTGLLLKGSSTSGASLGVANTNASGNSFFFLSTTGTDTPFYIQYFNSTGETNIYSYNSMVFRTSAGVAGGCNSSRDWYIGASDYTAGSFKLAILGNLLIQNTTAAVNTAHYLRSNAGYAYTKYENTAVTNHAWNVGLDSANSDGFYVYNQLTGVRSITISPDDVVTINGDADVKGIVYSDTGFQVSVAKSDTAILRLYNYAAEYSIGFANTIDHGTVTDWAMIFNMNSSANRGWIFNVYGGSPVASIDNTGNARFNGNIKTNYLSTLSNEIYEYATAADTAAVYINHRGYADGTTYFRDFYVRDGKNANVMFCDGSSKTTTFYGNVNITSGYRLIGFPEIEVQGVLNTTAPFVRFHRPGEEYGQIRYGNDGVSGHSSTFYFRNMNAATYASMYGNNVNAVGNIYCSGDIYPGNVTGLYIEPGANNALRIRTPSGKYLDIGPQNTAWSHFSTDSINGFYFTQNVAFDGNIYGYGGNENCGTSANPWASTGSKIFLTVYDASNYWTTTTDVNNFLSFTPTTTYVGNRVVALINDNDSYPIELRVYGPSQTCASVFAGQSAAYGGGMSYSGDGAPAGAGQGADYFALFTRNNGTDTWFIKSFYNNTDIYVNGQVIPNSSGTMNLGTSSYRWNSIYGVSLGLTGNATITGTLDVGNVLTISTSATYPLIIKDSAGAGAAANPNIVFQDSAGTAIGYLGILTSGTEHFYVNAAGASANLYFMAGGSYRWYISSTGDLIPYSATGTDIGNSTNKPTYVYCNYVNATANVITSGVNYFWVTADDYWQRKVSVATAQSILVTAATVLSGMESSCGYTFLADAVHGGLRIQDVDASAQGYFTINATGTDANVSAMFLYKGGSARWTFGSAATTNDSYIYSYGGGGYAIYIDYAHGGVTIGGAGSDLATSSYALHVEGSAKVNGNFYPTTTNTRYLGHSTLQWLYIYGQTIYENGVSLANKYAAIGSGSSSSPVFTDCTVTGNFYVGLHRMFEEGGELAFWNNSTNVRMYTGQGLTLYDRDTAYTAGPNTRVNFGGVSGAAYTIFGNILGLKANATYNNYNGRVYIQTNQSGTLASGLMVNEYQHVNLGGGDDYCGSTWAAHVDGAFKVLGAMTTTGAITTTGINLTASTWSWTGFSIYGGNNYVVVDTNGTVHAQASSLKYKYDVKNLEFDINTYLSMNPREFKWKANQEPGYGFIAEEVNAIMPILVGYDPTDGSPATVNYPQMDAFVHKVQQYHHQRIYELQQENAQLRAEYLALVARVEALENA